MAKGHFQKYPKFSLGDTLSVAEAVYKQNKSCKKSQLATALGYSETTSIFQVKTAAAKWYGLLTEEKGIVKCTSTAINIFAPYSTEEKQQALQKAFRSFDTFQQLLDHLPVDTKMSKDRIATLAERECNINVDGKDAFVGIFLESATFCKLLEEVGDGFFQKPALTASTEVEPTGTIPSLITQAAIAEGDIPTSQTTIIQADSAGCRVSSPPVTFNININVDANTTPEVIGELFKHITALKG